MRSDQDSGLGLEESPVEIGTVADLHEVECAVAPTTPEAVLSTNWLKFLRAALPRTAD